jgi:hypothetical protein
MPTSTEFAHAPPGAVVVHLAHSPDEARDMGRRIRALAERAWVGPADLPPFASDPEPRPDATRPQGR